MALEPITRKEKIIAGQDLTPITRMEMFLKQHVGGGGASVQSDWNQNDETAPDYVKNRPFYTGDTAETVLVEESTVSFCETPMGVSLGTVQSTFSATPGEIYKVSWDGTTYESACVSIGGNILIGNPSILGMGSDTGEPFLAIKAAIDIIVNTSDTSASHTISIIGDADSAVKIDRKYLPEAPIITHDSSAGTYSSDFTVEELYETLIEGKQVVYFNTNKIKYNYLISWVKNKDTRGVRIDLIFGGDAHVSLFSDGTIGETPNS